jgi:hypothetical protein
MASTVSVSASSFQFSFPPQIPMNSNELLDILLCSVLHLYSISMEYGNYSLHLLIHWTVNRSQRKPTTPFSIGKCPGAGYQQKCSEEKKLTA